MKIIFSFLLVTAMSLQAQAGPLVDYLNSDVSPTDYAAEIAQDPETFEEAIKAMAEEAQFMELTADDKLRIMYLESALTSQAAAYNKTVKRQNRMIKLGGVVIGTVIGGGLPILLHRTASYTATAPKNMVELGAGIITAYIEGVAVIGASIIGAGAGGAVGYIVSSTGFTKVELNVDNSILDKE